MKKIKAIAIFLFSLTLLTAQESTTLKSLKKYVYTLSSDTFEGRLSGSEGGIKAENYIEKEFKKIHLEKCPSLQSYKQSFLFTSSVTLYRENFVKVNLGLQNEILLKQEEDFIPASFSEDGEGQNAELVFASFGIDSKNPERRDYEGIDVKDKVVVVFRDGPDGKDPKSPYAPFYDTRYKSSVAREKGAKAIIVVSLFDKEDNLPKMRSGAVTGSSSIVVFSLKREVLKKIFEIEGIDFSGTERMKSIKPFAFKNVKVSFSIKLKREKSVANNIVGLLKATSKSDEYIVVGAHYDHLGRGIEGSLSDKWGEIHHGADDNASGVASLLEMAALLTKEKIRNKNIIFVAFGGEELGGLGSIHFTKNPPVDFSKIIAMVNLDMVGRFKEKLIVDGSGTAKEWKEILEKCNLDKFSISLHESGYGASDHSNFYAKKIPVLFFFTGAHSDYHLPSDTADKINYEGMEQIVKYAKRVIIEIMNMPQKPTFVEIEESKGRMANFSVYVGTVPDFSEEGKGFKILSVKKESPAEKAGIKGGDLLVSLGGKKIENIYDYTYILQEYNPGDEAEAIVIRDGKEIKLKIVFGSRKSSE